MLVGWRPSLVGWRPFLVGCRPSLVGWRPFIVGWRPPPPLVGWRPSLVGWRPFIVGWRPPLVGWRPSLAGWRPSLIEAWWAINRLFCSAPSVFGPFIQKPGTADSTVERSLSLGVPGKIEGVHEAFHTPR